MTPGGFWVDRAPLATIRGIAVNNDGFTRESITFPNGDAQAALARKVRRFKSGPSVGLNESSFFSLGIRQSVPSVFRILLYSTVSFLPKIACFAGNSAATDGVGAIPPQPPFPAAFPFELAALTPLTLTLLSVRFGFFPT